MALSGIIMGKINATPKNVHITLPDWFLRK